MSFLTDCEPNQGREQDEIVDSMGYLVPITDQATVDCNPGMMVVTMAQVNNTKDEHQYDECITDDLRKDLDTGSQIPTSNPSLVNKHDEVVTNDNQLQGLSCDDSTMNGNGNVNSLHDATKFVEDNNLETSRTNGK